MCLGICALWVRSYLVRDEYRRVVRKEGELNGSVWWGYTWRGSVGGNVTVFDFAHVGENLRGPTTRSADTKQVFMRVNTLYPPAYMEAFRSLEGTLPEGWRSVGL